MHLRNKLTKWLEQEGVIDSQDSELYDYGIQVFVIALVGWILAVVLGLIFNEVVEAFLFYFSFSFIRKYAGGIHTKSFASCFVISGVTMACIFLIIKYVPEGIHGAISIGLMIVFAPIIALLSPTASPEKPLTEQECEEFRRIVRKRLILILLLGTIFLFVKLYTEAMACSLSIMLQGGSLLAFRLTARRKGYLKSI